MARRKFEAAQESSRKITNPEPQRSGVCDNKMFYAERVKSLRTAANVTQAELANRLGLSRSAILNWEQGRTRPDISNIPALCRVLNVPVSQFFFSSGTDTGMNREEARLLRSYRNMNEKHQRFIVKMAYELEEMDTPSQKLPQHIHLLSLPYAEDAVAAGVGADGFEASCRQCFVHDTPALREADILFRVNGDSMEPSYPDGCTVLVKKSSQIDPGSIGVFSVDGTLYIKQCQPDGLHSINPDYPPMLSQKYGEIRLIGQVAGIMQDADFATEAEIRNFQAQK